MMSAAVQMLVAGVALTLIGTAASEWSAVRFSARSLTAFAYLVVFGSIVAYGSYTYAIQKLPLSIVSTYSYINPLIAVLLGWLVLSEPLVLACDRGDFDHSGRRRVSQERAERCTTAAAPACDGGAEQVLTRAQRLAPSERIM